MARDRASTWLKQRIVRYWRSQGRDGMIPHGREPMPFLAGKQAFLEILAQCGREHEKAYVNCMKGKGYTATKPN